MLYGELHVTQNELQKKLNEMKSKVLLHPNFFNQIAYILLI